MMVFRGSFHSSKQLYSRQAPHAERAGTNKGLTEDENPSDAGSQYANPLDEYCHLQWPKPARICVNPTAYPRGEAERG